MHILIVALGVSSVSPAGLNDISTGIGFFSNTLYQVGVNLRYYEIILKQLFIFKQSIVLSHPMETW